MLGRYAPGNRRASGPVPVIADVLRRDESPAIVTPHSDRITGVGTCSYKSIRILHIPENCLLRMLFLQRTPV